MAPIAAAEGPTDDESLDPESERLRGVRKRVAKKKEGSAELSDANLAA